MYTPKYYRNENIAEVKEFIVHNGFGILVSVQSTEPTASCGRPIGTHIPMLLDKNEKGEDILSGHVSRANPHHKLLAPLSSTGKGAGGLGSSKVLAIFLGPHAYVSSSWYSHENVPTWNYIAVHVYGKIKIIEGERLYRQLKMLVDKYEHGAAKPVELETMSQGYVKKQMGGIVGFEILIEEIQAAYKLSQNRNEQDYENVIRQLESRGDSHSQAVAGEMRKRKPKK